MDIKSLATAAEGVLNPISGVLGAVKDIGNFFGIGTGYRRAKKQAQRQFEYDKQLQELGIQQQKEANLELSDYAFDREVEMWNLQNEYNSPKSQMARFKEAGLNPALMYGQGTAGNATSLPSYQAPQVSKPQYMNPAQATMQNLALYNNIAFQRAQIANLHAQTRKTEVEAQDLLPTQVELFKTQMNKMTAEEKQILQKIDHEAGYYQYELKAKELANDYMSGKITTEQFIQSQIQADTDLKKRQQDLIGSQISNLSARTNLTNIQAARESYLTNFYLPLMVQAKTEELKKLRFDNKLDEKSYRAQLEKIHWEANKAGVDWNISQEKLENWQSIGQEENIIGNVITGIADGAISILTARFTKGWKVFRQVTKKGGTTSEKIKKWLW